MSNETTTRMAPQGASYGYRYEYETEKYWAVTVPHEHGPFDSAVEAEEFLRSDQDV